MGNFYKYNDKPGAGVSGLTTANSGDAIGDNEIIRGDGTTGIQGSTVTIDDAGTITIPAAESIEWSTDTGLARSAAGVVKVTDGSTGVGSLVVSDGNIPTPSLSFSPSTNYGFCANGGNVIASINGQAHFLIGPTPTGVSIRSDTGYLFAASTSSLHNYDTGIRRVAAGQIAVKNETNGQATNIKTSATTVNLTGATSTATGLFPAKCIQLGVTVRVTTLAASGDGGTSMNIGDGTDPDRYGATIAFAAGTTVNLSDATADPRGWAAAAGDVVFTCVGGTFNAGVVRVVAHYLDLTASTS